MKQISKDIRASIKYGLDHRAEAMEYALEFARGLDAQRADRFVGMYVNELTLDYGGQGRKAIRRLLRDAHKAGLIPKPPRIEFV